MSRSRVTNLTEPQCPSFLKEYQSKDRFLILSVHGGRPDPCRPSDVGTYLRVVHATVVDRLTETSESLGDGEDCGSLP